MKEETKNIIFNFAEFSSTNNLSYKVIGILSFLFPVIHG